MSLVWRVNVSCWLSDVYYVLIMSPLEGRTILENLFHLRARHIDVARLKRDRSLTPETLEAMRRQIDWPDVFVVPTGSKLKGGLLEEVLSIVVPKRRIRVVRVPASSDV